MRVIAPRGKGVRVVFGLQGFAEGQSPLEILLVVALTFGARKFG